MVLGDNRGLGVGRHGYKALLGHFLASEPRASHLTSLKPHFTLCKKEVLISEQIPHDPVDDKLISKLGFLYPQGQMADSEKLQTKLTCLLAQFCQKPFERRA